MPYTLDKLDKKFLRLLQENSRLTNLEIAQRVNLSPSPCLRRIRRLEDAGIIDRYTALLNPGKLGLDLLVFVNVRLQKQNNLPLAKHPGEDFYLMVKKWSEVEACYVMSGEMDYLLKIRVTNMSHFTQLLHERLLQYPAIMDVKSSFVLAVAKETTMLPIL